jgi:2-C-methyl-D-erythritol 2,4-cyclodiphosphate synthase
VSVRVGTGLDVHPFTDQPRPLVLGGVVIPDAPGLEGHSDADVLAHAVSDALLGAGARGDLGSRFGVDAPQTAGADSLDLLGAVVAELADEGWRLGNLDVTVVAQRPRLAGYREAMRERLAAVLRAPTGDVSVKFTTTDRLGTIGRGEGIATWASCVLEKAHR